MTKLKTTDNFKLEETGIKSAKKLYDRLYLHNSDEDTYKITFETENGLLKEVYHQRIIV